MLLLFLASCAHLKLCFGALQPNSNPNEPSPSPSPSPPGVVPTTAAVTSVATSSTPSARVNAPIASPPVDPTSAAAATTTIATSGAAGTPIPMHMVRAIPMVLRRSDLPDSDAFGVAQAHMLNDLPSGAPTLQNAAMEAAIATFQDDGATASLLALFNHPYRSAELRNFFDPKQPHRAELLSHYRFVRGRRVNGPFTPICHTSDTENARLRGVAGVGRVAMGKLVQKADVILGRMPAATDPARQLTVKEIVTVCGFPIPVSSAGRHVLRQSTFDRCGPACVAMVGLDLGCRMPPGCDFEPQSGAGSTAPWVKAKLEELCEDKISVAYSYPKDDNWLYVIVAVSEHFTLISNGQQPSDLRPLQDGAVPMTMRDPMCGIEFIVTLRESDDYLRTSMLLDADRAVLSIHRKVPPPVPVPAVHR